jgi:hypothetical protein
MDRPDPDIRPSARGVIIDGIDRYSRSAYVNELAGALPEGFEVLLAHAQALGNEATRACGFDDVETLTDQQRLHVRDAMLVAAWALTDCANEGHGQNPLGFVQRAKQVIDWCKPKTEGTTVLAALEERGRELARTLAERIWRNEGFVVLLFDQAVNGHFTWLTSIDRRQAISLIAEALQAMRNDQGARS